MDVKDVDRSAFRERDSRCRFGETADVGSARTSKTKQQSRGDSIAQHAGMYAHVLVAPWEDIHAENGFSSSGSRDHTSIYLRGAKKNFVSETSFVVKRTPRAQLEL